MTYPRTNVMWGRCVDVQYVGVARGKNVTVVTNSLLKMVDGK